MLPAPAAPSPGAAAHLPRRHGQRHVNAPGSPTAASTPTVQAGTRARHTARTSFDSVLSGSSVPGCAGEWWDAAERVCLAHASPPGLPSREVMGSPHGRLPSCCLLTRLPVSSVGREAGPGADGVLANGSSRGHRGTPGSVTDCSHTSPAAPQAPLPGQVMLPVGGPAGCPGLRVSWDDKDITRRCKSTKHPKNSAAFPPPLVWRCWGGGGT